MELSSPKVKKVLIFFQKNVKLAELNIRIATVFLNTQILKTIYRIQMFMLSQKGSTKL